MARTKLLVATRNSGKMREYRQLLQDIPFELVSLEEVGVFEEVKETGFTFAENASLKARTYSGLGGLLTLADDSGLEVDALGGEPGVHSARYGEIPPLNTLENSPQHTVIKEGSGGLSDQDRVRLLLHNLEGVPWSRRTARFRCVLAISSPPSGSWHDGGQVQTPFDRENDEEQTGAFDVILLVGSVAGMIQYEPMGEEGFGYDPVFYLPSYGLTMAQLPLEEKNRISHRANAAGKAMKALCTVYKIHRRGHRDR